MAIAIKVENLSKAYQLGEIGTGTLSRDIERWFAKVRGKEDPLLKVGETNDRTSKGTSDVVWSLKDINFEFQQGDAVGIIGRNGAGKSTLLKLLTRVTSPTTGSIKVKGRIASLLEVGTGFHPELTGRENIYLNGAILGMRKREITRKFDEIVAFSGVERYIDTPVKRYSSGMYVRLAFAVAAHLESEILIVDEVLAVGDAEFQKKCLGKMNDVSKGEGRTVLFVSHNMGAIQQLTDKALLLKNGGVVKYGTTEEVMPLYFLDNNKENAIFNSCTNDASITLKTFKIVAKNDQIRFLLEIQADQIATDLKIGVGICSNEGSRLFTTFGEIDKLGEGLTQVEISPEKNYLAPGNYIVTLGVNRKGVNIYFNEMALKFEINEENIKDAFLIERKDKIGLFIPSAIIVKN